jgi:hypothetical protein
METKVQLTEDQITHLFKFVRSKYVHYIDLQYELVDHLASAIEEEMVNGKLDFYQALNAVYRRFPITGFTQIIAAKRGSLFTYYIKIIFENYIKFLGNPIVLFTLMVVFISSWYAHVLCKSYTIGLMILAILLDKISYFRLRKYFNVTNRYLFISAMKFITILISLIFLHILIRFQKPNYEISFWAQVVYINVITLYIIWIIFKILRAPSFIKNEISQRYSHLKIEIE